MSATLQSELEAIRTGAAIYPLTDRAFLRITGPDATRWLNGMVTNNIKDLAPGEGNYNFLLNAQGRIQGDCTIYRDGPSYLLETDGSQVEEIGRILEKFIIMDDVEIARVFEAYRAITFVGPKAVSVLQALEVSIPEAHHFSHAGYQRDGQKRPVLITAFGTQTLPEFQIYCHTDSLEHVDSSKLVQEDMQNAGAGAISAEAIEAYRILSGKPKYGQDIRDKDLPQETAQTHALHFNKGCYLGQEIVERIRSRGQVHRTFTQFTLTGELPTLPAPLTANEKPAGEITSAMKIGDTIHALGYLRREAATATLSYPGGTATLRAPLA